MAAPEDEIFSDPLTVKVTSSNLVFEESPMAHLLLENGRHILKEDGFKINLD